LIEQVGALAKLTNGYQPAYLTHRWNYNPTLCRELAGEEAQRIGTDEAERKLEWLDGQLDALDLPQRLPMGVCHSDFHYTNVLFEEDKFSGLIDFDDANYTYLLFDLACLIDTWAWARNSEQLDFIQAGQIVSAYNKVRPLSALERHHVYDIHKLSILFDCIWYFQRGPADDFREKRKVEFLHYLGRAEYQRRLCGALGV
jgi:Ser/Thr protein kinase RdoA (MazF antagonist)